MNSQRRHLKGLLFAACCLAGTARAAESVTVSVSKIKDLNLRIYGFVETDFIRDTTASLNEEAGNTPIQQRIAFGGGASNRNGQHGRTQMSVRNSRLGFDLTLPKTDFGLDSEAILELDLLGNNAPNTTPGSGAPGSQSERDFFNNPALRVRHAYMNLTYQGWNAKVGQTWSLLGWQPYYFPGEVIVQPGPGQLYRRFAQARVMYTLPIQDAWTLESAADLAKPAQMNSASPEWHGGLRFASTKYKGASIGGAGSSMVGLSAAVSGALIPIQTNGFGNPVGQAVAFDAFVPILPSSDGKDRSNNLVWGGELMSGSGVGGLEYSGLSQAPIAGIGGVKGGNVANLPAGVLGTGNTIDSGIAGVNQDGNAELVRYRIFRNHLQYTLPGGMWSTSVGYAQVEARNLDRFANALNGNGGGLTHIPKIQFGYVSLFCDPLAWLRVAAEWNQTRDTYNDPNNRFAVNNRFQLSTFFVF